MIHVFEVAQFMCNDEINIGQGRLDQVGVEANDTIQIAGACFILLSFNLSVWSTAQAARLETIIRRSANSSPACCR